MYVNVNGLKFSGVSEKFSSTFIVFGHKKCENQLFLKKKLFSVQVLSN